MFVPVSPDASGFWICQKLWHHQCNSAGCRTWNKLKKLGFMCLIRRDLCVLIQPVSSAELLFGRRGGCHYRGYIEGFPSSAVTLSTCSGLRGLLQFENVSYGIEPLGYSPAFEHFVYRVSDEKTAGSLLASSHPERGPGGLAAEEMILTVTYLEVNSVEALLLNGHLSSVANLRNKVAPLSAAARSPKYFKVYVVLDKALLRVLWIFVSTLFCFIVVNALSALMSSWVIFQYNYMGSDTNAATQKIIQVFNLVNSMFSALNVTIVLSSVELWTEKNKISTAGEADDLLQRFLQWKQSYLTLRSYDIAYLLVYRDRAAFVGATAPGKGCQRDAAGAVAVYQEAVTLESFSVLLAQLLGRSLGLSYDDSRDCRCPGHVCLMSPEALRFSGAKAFSSCSIRDFETFLKHDGGACLFNRPRLTGLSYRRAAVCGNGVVEPGEQCDCGAAEACLKDKCCTKTCRFKPGVKCSSGLCCNECQFKRKNSQCRPPADAQCDLAEFCNGSSASCPPDLYVQDGHGCEHGTGYCYKGRCQSPDLQCRRLYGRGSRGCSGCTGTAGAAPVQEVAAVPAFGGNEGLGWRDVRGCTCTYPIRVMRHSALCKTCALCCGFSLCVQFGGRRESRDCGAWEGWVQYPKGGQRGGPNPAQARSSPSSSEITVKTTTKKQIIICSKNAPVACYEELNSQRDRFGHCGFQPRLGYKSCAWRNLRCGKLICTYPYSTPFPSDAAAVLYVRQVWILFWFRQVQSVVMESISVLDIYKHEVVYFHSLLGHKTDGLSAAMVCINNTCHPHSVLGYDCDSKVKCHGHGFLFNEMENLMVCLVYGGGKKKKAKLKEHGIEGSGASTEMRVGFARGLASGSETDAGLGRRIRCVNSWQTLTTRPRAFQVCNNKRHCHCHPGWKPPNCLQKGSHFGGSVDSGLHVTDSGLSLRQALEDTTSVWPVLGSCLLLLALAGAVCLILRRRVLGRRCGRQPPSMEGWVGGPPCHGIPGGDGRCGMGPRRSPGRVEALGRAACPRLCAGRGGAVTGRAGGMGPRLALLAALLAALPDVTPWKLTSRAGNRPHGLAAARRPAAALPTATLPPCPSPAGPHSPGRRQGVVLPGPGRGFLAWEPVCPKAALGPGGTCSSWLLGVASTLFVWGHIVVVGFCGPAERVKLRGVGSCTVGTAMLAGTEQVVWLLLKWTFLAWLWTCVGLFKWSLLSCSHHTRFLFMGSHPALLLGRSLGLSYDDSRDCRCPGHVCLMSPEALCQAGAAASAHLARAAACHPQPGRVCTAPRSRGGDDGGVSSRQRCLERVLLRLVTVNAIKLSFVSKRCLQTDRTVAVYLKRFWSLRTRFSGAKAFSSCSIGDFETFLKQNRDCPFIRHALRQPSYRAAVCGNGVVEPGEQCDCGAAEACALDKCCTPQCNFKPGMKCSLGLCCENCQFKRKNSQCRPPADAQCDLAEFCNGSSASCPPDLYVQDGHGCEHGTGYCYKGRCQSPDLQCQALYGKGAKNAPLACYEEVNSQQDRFGHCGNHLKDGYRPCSWPNLGCGKLVCTYPNRIPFTKVKGAIIYAQVQEHLCVSFDFMRGPTVLDPLLVKEGTKCGPRKVCMNGTCHPHSVLKYDCNVQKKCHGHGVCNNKKNCHCDPGWNPPQCRTRGAAVGGSIDSALHPDRIAKSSALAVPKNWLLLSFGIVLLTLVCGTVVITKWSRLKTFCARRGSQTDGPAAEEGSDGRDTDTEPEPDPDPDTGPGPRRGR
ncbi:uncharacterized protein WM294_012864 [Sarcoramphus papa]